VHLFRFSLRGAHTVGIPAMFVSDGSAGFKLHLKKTREKGVDVAENFTNSAVDGGKRSKRFP
jgi:hypothetical protein